MCYTEIQCLSARLLSGLYGSVVEVRGAQPGISGSPSNEAWSAYVLELYKFRVIDWYRQNPDKHELVSCCRYMTAIVLKTEMKHHSRFHQ